MLFDCQVNIWLRDGVADPQGSTIERSLPALGFKDIHNVRVGKTISFNVEAQDEDEALIMIESVSERFLANPVIETTDIHLTKDSEV